MRLRRDFFARDALVVAPDLLGTVIRVGPVAGRITEVEAYRRDDPASHSFRGQTPRNTSMFAGPATLYVYISYGIHCCANVVTGDPSRRSGCAAACRRDRRGRGARRHAPSPTIATGVGEWAGQAVPGVRHRPLLRRARPGRRRADVDRTGSPSTTRTSRPASASPSPSTIPGAGSSLAAPTHRQLSEMSDLLASRALPEVFECTSWVSRQSGAEAASSAGEMSDLLAVELRPEVSTATSWVSRQSGADAASSAGEDERLARESSMA